MKRIITICVLALSFAIAASAFGTKYHATVAYIAEQHMTAKAKANFHKAFGNRHLVEYASYPDFYRDIYNVEGIPVAHVLFVDENFEAISHTKGSYSAYDSILWGTKQLQNYKTMDDSLKVFALTLVVHCMGDTHCPSHKYYDDDRNKIKNIYYKSSLGKEGDGTKIRFHAFCDYYAMDHRYPGGFVDMAYYIDTCTKEEIAQIQKGGINDWMHATAVDCKDLYDIKSNQTVDRIYTVNQAEKYAIQVRNAGYRLAALLNQIFGK